MNNKKVEGVAEVARYFLDNDNFNIICHNSPDGDTLGAGYALCEALQSIDKKAMVSCHDAVPLKFQYLKEGIVEEDITFTAETVHNVAVDVADIKLISKKWGEINFCIDHHVSNALYAANTFLEPKAAATCEIMYFIIEALNVKFTRTLVNAIYTGIATDTGCFKFSCTTGRTHYVAFKLMETGFDVSEINYNLFELKSKERLRLEEEALANMEFYDGGRIALVVLTTAVIGSDGSEEMDGIASLPHQIEGVLVGVTIKQKGEKWKISVRTGKEVDAQNVCKALGGGGHVRAAGCSFTGTAEEAKAAILSAIRDVM